MGMSFFRRIASLFFVLAFVASAQAHAVFMMPMAKTDFAVTVTMPEPMTGDCNDCSQHDLMAKADCKATCIPVLALAPDNQANKLNHLTIASMWKGDRADTRETAPDTTPPRS